MKWPELSIVTPTLNSERTLDECLKAIRSQRYEGKIEIIIVDGGSTDKTLQISRKYKVEKIVKNPLKTGEAGKSIGVKNSSGEIIVFIDSDNILPTNDWLEKMVIPFLSDSSIVATEPAFFSYRKKDHWLTRYFALIGMGDPINLFVGNYDRYSYVTNKWTGLKLDFKKDKEKMIITLDNKIMPTIGANGFLIKRKEIIKYPLKDYLFDIDVLKFLTRNKKIKVVKVKIGIVHLFSGDIMTFIRKQTRRIRDFTYYKNVGIREDQTSGKRLLIGISLFVISNLLIIPILIQTLIGFFRKPDWVWLFHPLACLITLFVYSTEAVKSVFIKKEYSRNNWRQ